MNNKENIGNRISVIELSSYVKPEIVESYTENKFISFGVNNSYYDYLADCYNTSPTNRAICNSIAGMIYKDVNTIASSILFSSSFFN